MQNVSDDVSSLYVFPDNSSHQSRLFANSQFTVNLLYRYLLVLPHKFDIPCLPVMSTEAFELYANELEQLLSAQPLDEDAAQDLLQQMALEARGMESDDKRLHLDRCKTYKSKVQAIQLADDRRELLGGGGDGSSNPTPGSTADALTQQNAALARARQSLSETEEVAASISTNLAHQRDTLQHTRDGTNTVVQLTSKAHTIADNLLKPWWRRK